MVKSFENKDRFESKIHMKNLVLINQAARILREGKPIEETLRQVCHLLPSAWQFPNHAVIRIKYKNKEYLSPEFKETQWSLKQEFETKDNFKGTVEVLYLKKFPIITEGPFTEEEKLLIKKVTSLIKNFLDKTNNKQLKEEVQQKASEQEKDSINAPIISRKLLQKFLNKQDSERDIYHDLMPFKVREILLVANLYDAYSLEKEGQFSDQIFGEYHQLNLSSLPRITAVSTFNEIKDQLNSRHFDLVIIMIGIDKQAPIELSTKIKNISTYIPIFLLLNNNSELAFFENKKEKLSSINKIFIWNGDSKVFFAMVKHLEDIANVENDTRIGLVNVILLVEDSPKYYSRYLPLLYDMVLHQTKEIIEDVNTDELYKVLRLRARPKIIIASNYEEAIDFFNKYKDFLLCLITDVKFERNGKFDENAGFKLVKYIRKQIPDVPTLIQSSDLNNYETANKLNVSFTDKNSENLILEIKTFISTNLGYGSFVYRTEDGKQIAIATSLKEFESHLRKIPDESLLYHAKRNQYSLWLMARGEVEIAKIINPGKVEDFKSPQEIREYLLSVIHKQWKVKRKGKVISFEESAVLDETNIVTLSSGAFGGKGRGLAFINSLIYNYDFHQLIPDINICVPKTSIIGTDEYELFMDRNNLHEKVYNETDYNKVKKWFLKGKLSQELTDKIKIIHKLINRPLAVRSSGLFEDSIMQPFAGIYATYLLPNNHSDIKVRINQTMNAIKLIYASIFSNTARDYIEAINYKIEDERMAVIIQEVVGNQFKETYYPHISGIAQSYNYYPFAYMKPEEGYVVAAVGLGQYVVDGEKAYRFSPHYPTLEINTPINQLKNSQLEFYAVDLKKKNVDLMEGEEAGLIKLDIGVAEKHGSIKHCASVYDKDNLIIIPGLNKAGPRIINFANILKYNYIPLAKTFEIVLNVVQEAFGSAVEIEFAVDLNKDQDGRTSFYLLQIKPLIGNFQDYIIDIDKINEKTILLYTENGMGNGIIKEIEDVIYIDNNKFDKSRTAEMVEEIEELNRIMIRRNKKYILIGPGRWGTSDRWIGIPVKWTQISNAKIIVETSIQDFPLNASSGSHFFNNVTSMNVGYFNVKQELANNIIRWDMLDKQRLIEKTKFFKHVQFEKPLTVKMDGKKRISLITFDGEE